MNVTYETLLACQTGPKGIELQFKAENETHTVARPYPPFVPFVVYNRVGFYPQLCSLPNLAEVMKAHS